MAEVLIENGLETWVTDLGYKDWIIIDNAVVQVVHVDRLPDGKWLMGYRHISGSATSSHSITVDGRARYQTLGLKLKH